MKRHAIAIAATMFAASAGAGPVYDELAKDNPDIKAHKSGEPAAVGKSGTVTEANVYKGLAKDNADLKGKSKTPTPGTGGEDPDVYEEVDPNPDVQY